MSSPSGLLPAHNRPSERSAAAVVRFMAEAAARAGLEVRVLDPQHGYLFELGRDGRFKPMIGGRSSLNDAVAARLAGDKFYTGVVLARHGIRTPNSVRCLAPGAFSSDRFRPSEGSDDGLRLAARSGYPLIVKPNSLSHGRGVRAVSSDEELAQALEAIWQLDRVALVSDFVPGTDLRLDFLDGEFLFGYRRFPIIAMGDGTSTLRQLIEEIDPRRRGDSFWLTVERDVRWQQVVSARGLSVDSVLPAGERLALGGRVLNLHQWAAATPVGEIPRRWLDWAREVGKALRLRHYGIDLRGPGLEQSPAEATVIEANASPLLLGMYHAGFEEEALDAQARVLRLSWEADRRLP